MRPIAFAYLKMNKVRVSTLDNLNLEGGKYKIKQEGTGDKK